MPFLGRSARAVALALFCGIAREAAAAETVYWVDQFNGKLQRLDLSSGEVSDVLTNPVVVPRNIVFDRDSGKMYWEDSETFKIQRANLDGSQLEDLIVGGDFSRPTSVVLDSVSQKMFWAQGDAVRRADTDGTDVENVAESQLRPEGLALDGAGKLYWDDDVGRIQRANLDGSAHEVLVTTGAFFQTPVALDVARGKMYWAASAIGSAGKIQRANLDGSVLEDLVSLGLFPAQQLTVDPDGQKIYWSDFFPSAAIRRANLDGSNVEDVVASGLVLPRSFAVDSAGGKIYWTEEQDRKIRRADLSGGNVEDLVSEGVQFPEGIRLDASAGKMYWTDAGTGKIQRAELTGANVFPASSALPRSFGPTSMVPTARHFFPKASAHRAGSLSMSRKRPSNGLRIRESRGGRRCLPPDHAHGSGGGNNKSHRIGSRSGEPGLLCGPWFSVWVRTFPNLTELIPVSDAQGAQPQSRASPASSYGAPSLTRRAGPRTFTTPEI